MSWRGKTVVVTGASGGLGRALCLHFGKLGANIVGLDVDKKALETLQVDLDRANITHLSEFCDITDPQACTNVIDQAVMRFGGVDLLFNNAGITHLSKFEHTEIATIRKVIDVNLMGAVHCTKACLQSLIARKGSVVAISSVAGFAPLVGRCAYSASKHALHGFFDSLRTELKDQGVHVLTVCPSLIDTPIRQRVLGDTPDKGHSMGKNTSPEEIAARIACAVDKRHRNLITGTVGHLAYWIKPALPWLYDTLMLRKYGPGIDSLHQQGK